MARTTLTGVSTLKLFEHTGQTGGDVYVYGDKSFLDDVCKRFACQLLELLISRWKQALLVFEKGIFQS